MAKILVVDDSMITRKHLQKLLSENGYEVNCAPEGESALKLMDEQSFDLVLMDQLMPGLEGLDVLQRMRQHSIECPVIMLTADTQRTTRENLIRSGASAVIGKPPESKKLLSLIQTNLEN